MNVPLRTTPLQDALQAPEQFPLQAHALDQPDEVCIQRMWSKVDTRPATAQSKAQLFSLSGNGFFALASAALFVLAFITTTSYWDQRSALHLEAGAQAHELESTIHASQSARTLSFDDGSSIQMNQGAALSVLNNEGSSFITKLNEGRARFSVQPGGPRRWVIEAGDVSVEVVGTVFTVERDARGTSVSVERGTVIVNGNVPNGAVTLTRGMRIESHRPERARDSSQPGSSPAEQPSSEKQASPEAQPDAVSPANTSPGISLSDLEDEAPDDQSAVHPQLDQAQDSTAHPRKVPDTQEDDLGALLTQGDTARRQGDLQAAAEAYAAAAKLASPGDPRGAMASLSFAKVAADPAAVMSVLKKGLPAMPPSLREPALARLVRACQRAGRPEEAATFANQYIKEFPTGPRLKLVRSWAAQP